VTKPETPDIDRRLREAFQDEPAATARVVRAALATDNGRGSRRAQEAFEDDAAAAARVVRVALADGDRSDRFARASVEANVPRARQWWIAVGAIAAMLLVASALVYWPARPLPEPAAEPSELSGYITDGALVVSMPDGSVLISAGEPRTDRPPDGFALVILEGVTR